MGQHLSPERGIGIRVPCRARHSHLCGREMAAVDTYDQRSVLRSFCDDIVVGVIAYYVRFLNTLSPDLLWLSDARTFTVYCYVVR